MYKKLFIPGPTHVREEILQAQAEPMIGHRAREYAALQAEVTAKLQKMLYTEQIVFLFAASSTGVMEGAVRNLQPLA
jgi:aspartate aminotransferase-like enzyme